MFNDLLSLYFVSEVDIFNAIQCLKLTKFVGFDEVSGFIIKNCPVTAASTLIHIFYFSLSVQHFPTLWKQAAVAPIVKTGNSALFSSYTPTGYFAP